MDLTTQLIWLFTLAIPIACISWTVTHEEIVREFREYCAKKSQENSNFLIRKFFYLLTCEYCFSHYVTMMMLAITRYTLLFSDWRGYLIAGFSLVWIGNVYMSLYSFLRVDIKKEGMEAKIVEKKVNGDS